MPIDAPHRRRGAIAVLGLALAVLLCLLVTSSTHATTPGANGRILYSKLVGDYFGLFTILPDGTGATRIASSVTGDVINADWSPDGGSIVFENDRPDAKGCRIMLMAADGSGLTDLTGTQGGDCENQPSFTPDGRRIVFVRYDEAPDIESIWSMDLTGEDRRPITPQKGTGVTDPNVSPDGQWISYVRQKAEGKLQALFAIHPDGSGRRQLTPFRWEVAIKHDWSPDGKRIVVTTNADFVRPHDSANLVTVRPDGTGAKNLTRFAGGKKNAFAGSFSPDGKHIVFRLEQGQRYALAVIDPNGHHLRLLTKLSKDKPRFIDWGTHP